MIMDRAEEIRRTMSVLAETMIAVMDEREQLKVENQKLNSKLDTANALVTCCCGSPVDMHGMGDGHSPVDMYHYAHARITEQNEKLTLLVKLLLDNDPAELVSDGGHTVLDLWRHDAREVLGNRA